MSFLWLAEAAEAHTAWNLGAALPEWILAATALWCMFRDARGEPGPRPDVAKASWVGLMAATVAVCWQFVARTDTLAFRGHYEVDDFALVFKLIFGITGLIVLVLSRAWLRRVDRGHGEFHMLALFATLGMFFVCSVRDFAGLFVSLELITVSFYCLTAFKRNDPKAVEAGLKYVILGALASAFLVLGIAFVYGATGSLDLDALSGGDHPAAVAHGGGPLLTFGLLLVLVGLGFKIAAVPFQVWTPDVYEGAASPVTAFLSVGSKAAGFVLLLKVVRGAMGPDGTAGLAEDAGPWLTIVAVMSIATLLYGNLGAMWQSNIKRLMGYSSIGHAGYVLMGVAAFDGAGFSAVTYYLLAYLFTSLGAFAVIIIVNGATRSHELDDYSGLGKRSPLLAMVLTCALLSLAGVPPMAGFFGKFLVFKAIVAKGGVAAYTMAFVGAAGVVISMYYYLCVVMRLYIREPSEEQLAQPIPVTKSLKRVLYACLAGILILGILVQPFLAMADQAASALLASR